MAELEMPASYYIDSPTSNIQRPEYWLDNPSLQRQNRNIGGKYIVEIAHLDKLEKLWLKEFNHDKYLVTRDLELLQIEKRNHAASKSFKETKIDNSINPFNSCSSVKNKIDKTEGRLNRPSLRRCVSAPLGRKKYQDGIFHNQNSVGSEYSPLINRKRISFSRQQPSSSSFRHTALQKDTKTPGKVAIHEDDTWKKGVVVGYNRELERNHDMHKTNRGTFLNYRYSTSPLE